MLTRTPGIVAVLAMAALVALAHGLGGPVRTEQPSTVWLDDELRHQLKLDEQVTIITGPDGGELSPQAERALEQAAAVPRGAARPVRPRPYVRDYRVIALREAKAAGIRNPKLFVRQIAAESGFQICARSGAGALGIAQIMPGTARSWKVDPFMPEQALRVAARRMSRYEKQYGSYVLALAAYNAGPGAVAQYKGVPPYPETRGYIRRITHRRERLLGLNQTFRLPAGLTPRMKRRLYALQKDVRRHGGKVWIGEGWRSYDDQVRLWKAAKKKYGGFNGARRWVAPPGCSNHGRGWAADLGGNLELAHQLAPRHGLVFPMAHEPWHVEMAGIPTQSG